MPKKIVIIGAVALGPKVACRARRMDPDAEILMLDKDSNISYGGCGIPYYVSGDIPDVKELSSTIYHATRDESFFRSTKRVEVRTNVEALAIDRKNKTVRVHDIKTGTVEDIPYDILVLGTGSTAVIPPIPGADLPGVTAISNLHHAVEIKNKIAKGEVESAVVVGGGAIGLEMAEALTVLWGVKTTLVEMQEQLLPVAVGPDLAGIIRRYLEKNEVKVLTGDCVSKIIGNQKSGVTGVETGAGFIPCQLIIFAIGVRPNTHLAREAGLAIGSFGGILVDRRMRTSDPNIFAGGDCVEVQHQITGQRVILPLGSLANRQGRVIGTNVSGGNEQWRGAVGTLCLKAFDLGIARAGLTTAQAIGAGFDAVDALIAGSDKAHFYPGHKPMFIRLIADRKTRRVLGIEAVSENGDAVKARVDAVAALLSHGVCVDEISNLEVGYAPPFASAMDIVNAAANALENVLDDRGEAINVLEFLDQLDSPDLRVLDVRTRIEAEPYVNKYGKRWQNIPLDELQERLGEIPTDEPLIVICSSGVRSFEAQVLLRQKGIANVKNVQGGTALVELLKDVNMRNMRVTP